MLFLGKSSTDFLYWEREEHCLTSSRPQEPWHVFQGKKSSHRRLSFVTCTVRPREAATGLAHVPVWDAQHAGITANRSTLPLFSSESSDSHRVSGSGSTECCYLMVALASWMQGWLLGSCGAVRDSEGQAGCF